MRASHTGGRRHELLSVSLAALAVSSLWGASAAAQGTPAPAAANAENAQSDQPIIVTGPDLPVSISPQEGFLHEEAEVDTLGVDQPETKCKFK